MLEGVIKVDDGAFIWQKSRPEEKNGRKWQRREFDEGLLKMESGTFFAMWWFKKEKQRIVRNCQQN